MIEVVILANKGTNERMAILSTRGSHILKDINEKFGGNWIKVNNLEFGDVLRFVSTDVYRGYDGRDDDNYCKGNLLIKTLNPTNK